MQAYLDNSATTKPFASALAAAVEAGEYFYNPSAAYGKALGVIEKMDKARAGVLAALGAKQGRVVFTSGGTEADNIAVFSSMKRRGAKTILTTAVEHPAVLNAVRNFDHALIPVDENCEIDLNRFESLVKENAQGLGLVSVMRVNNETGAVYPVDEMARIVKENSDALFHCDNVQGFLHAPVFDLKNIDLVSVSGHKVNAVKGVGALYLAQGLTLKESVYGGGQEGGFRSGTENTFGIFSLQAAVDEHKKLDPEAVRPLKMRLYEGIQKIYPKAQRNGPDPQKAAAHILNMSFPGVLAEVLLHALEADGIYVSTGSACAARQNHPSHVLTAMGCSKDRISSSLRFSLGCHTTQDEIDYTLERLQKHLAILARFVRR